MIVRLTGELSGTRDGREWPPRGSVIDLPDDEAIPLCENGMAIPVPVTESVEVAVVPVDMVEERGSVTVESAPALGRRTKRAQ